MSGDGKECKCSKESPKKQFKETNYKKQVPIIGGSNVEIDLPPDRKIGGSKKKVEGSKVGSAKVLKVAKVTAVEKKPMEKKQTEWQKILSKTMKEKSMTMKNAIKFIKDNHLYEKKK
jgi:hypothetical protein